MPLRKGKKVAQQTSNAAPVTSVPTKGTLTSEQISVALVQLLELKLQVQQQIDTLVAHQNRAQPTNHLTKNVSSGRTRQYTRAHPTRMEDA